MWKLFQRDQALRGVVKISALDLSVLLKSLDSRLIVFDLRGRDDAEQYPYIIPGALLTTETELLALIGWLPPSTPLVLYAMDRIPQSCFRLPPLRNDLSFYTLIGGLRAWWEADCEMDSVEHYAGGLRARD
jgi:hypothetical protein